ncbi:hypothetical protein OGZ01_19915 [Vibrio harveyi]|nr:hypothetical protein [Vibrio harveyi]
MDEFGIVPTAIDIIGAVEVTDKASQRQLFQDSETLCRFAQAVGAPTIQLNAFEALNGLTKEQNIELTAQNIRQIVDIGKSYGIRFQYEGAAWTPIAKLEDYFRLYDAVLPRQLWFCSGYMALMGMSRGNVGTSGKYRCRAEFYNVHLSDGKRPAPGEAWPMSALCVVTY